MSRRATEAAARHGTRTIRFGTFYAHSRHKLGRWVIGRRCSDWPAPVRDGWVIYWNRGPHAGRVMALQMESQTPRSTPSREP